VRPRLVVITSPVGDHSSRVREVVEVMIVQLVKKLLLKLSMYAFCVGLPATMSFRSTPQP
jgi:hypothetical protein